MLVFSMEDRAISVMNAVMSGHKSPISRFSTPECDAVGIAISVVKLGMLHVSLFRCSLNAQHLSAISQKQLSLVECVDTLRC